MSSAPIHEVLRDAAKFILQAIADGNGDPMEAQRLALLLSWQTGEHEQMSRALYSLKIINPNIPTYDTAQHDQGTPR